MSPADVLQRYPRTSPQFQRASYALNRAYERTDAMFDLTYGFYGPEGTDLDETLLFPYHRAEAELLREWHETHERCVEANNRRFN